MLKIKEYIKAESLEQAYQLNQKRQNRIIGGMLWLKMSSGNVGTAIDLSGLGLDTIEETEDSFIIGAMTTLRDLETHPGLNRYTNQAVRESVRHIVGVQFRNLATVGGSLYGRFGFSDVLTMFLGLDAQVELYHAGLVPITEFAAQKPDRDVLVRIHVKKTPLSCVYLSQRNTKTDFPVLTCMLSDLNGHLRAVIGARPQKAVAVEIPENLYSSEITEEQAEQIATYVQNHISTGSNMRASAEYRSRLAFVLTKRACKKIGDTAL